MTTEAMTVVATVTLAAGHRVRGRRGDCAMCGFRGALDGFGLLRAHRQHRIGPKGRSYVSADACEGSGQAPGEPLDL